ncbi:MAG: hypothetical protein IKO91_06200 [Oscillospiraceae bacterium]|nr:hypothetical protein [Oscillospiraceae bacterium]
MGVVILAIVNFVVLTVVSRLIQKLYMKITGASVVFFDGKKRIGTILVASIVLATLGI